MDHRAYGRIRIYVAGVVVAGWMTSVAGMGTSEASVVTCGSTGDASVSGVCTYSTPGTDVFNVPAGVSEITIEAYGAQGGAGVSGSSGGLGGKVVETWVAEPGGQFDIQVGGQGGSAGSPSPGSAGAAGTGGGGAGGFSSSAGGGGGGGGWSGVYLGPYYRIVMAGGGGGAGAEHGGCDGISNGGAGGGQQDGAGHGLGCGGNAGNYNAGRGGADGTGGNAGASLCASGGYAGFGSTTDGGDGTPGTYSAGWGGGGGGGGGGYGGGGGGVGSTCSLDGGGGGGGGSFGRPGYGTPQYFPGVRSGGGLVVISFTAAVPKQDQTISFTSTAPSGAVVDGPTYTPTATATSNLTVVLTVAGTSSGVCAMDAFGVVSFVGGGTCTINANQPGDATYNAAPQAQQSFAVSKLNQTVSFTSTAPEGAGVDGDDYSVSAEATSGLDVAIAVAPASAGVCTLDGGLVSLDGAGTCTLNADQAGNGVYNAATQVQQSFAVSGFAQSVWFGTYPPVPAYVGDEDYLVSAYSDAGLTVALTIDGSSTGVCSIDAGAVSLDGAGLCTINADQAGEGAYEAAQQVQQSFTISKRDQTVEFTSDAPEHAVIGGDGYDVTAEATSELEVAITLDGAPSSVCRLDSGTVSFTGAGTCTLNADQAGNDAFNAATQVQQSFTVYKGTQTISFDTSAPEGAYVGDDDYLVGASSDAPLTVALTIDEASDGVCSIDAGAVSLDGAGLCTINADQAGDGTYEAAQQVQQSFTISKRAQAVHFTTTPTDPSYVGDPAYLVAAESDSPLTVSLSLDALSVGVCALDSGSVTFVGVGTCTINADQAGDGTYLEATQVQQSFAVAQRTQTIGFDTDAPSAAVVGGTPYLVSASSTSNLPVTLTVDGSSGGVCALDAGSVTFQGGGTCTINADQAGNATYTAAARQQQSFSVAKLSQTLQFTSTAPSNAAVGGASYTAIADATSGLTAALSIDGTASTVCSIAGSVVTFQSAGTCTINADQAGNGAYDAAPQVQQSFAVSGKLDQVITFGALADRTLSQSPFNVTATSSSGLQVSFSSTTAGICTSSGTRGRVITLIATGECTIAADQAGSATYNPAATELQSFDVLKNNQTISFGSLSNRTMLQSPFTVTASASSGLPVTFAATPVDVCSSGGTNGATITLAGAGTCTVQAEQVGNLTTYNAAPSVSRSFTVSRVSQTISFGKLANRTIVQTPLTVTATASSGLAVSFTTTTPLVCTSGGTNGTSIVLVGAGTCTVKADQGGTGTYAPAASALQSFTVSKLSQTISFGKLSNRPLASSPFSVSATASSGLAVTFSSATPLVCTSTGTNGATITLLARGGCTITATQSGSSVYAAAPSTNQSFRVQ